MKAVPATKLFSAFMAWPLPGPPTSNSRVPIFGSTGFAAATAAASPPIMIASEPSVARGTPPDTGASTKARPRCGEVRMGCARADRIGRAHVDHQRALRQVRRERAAFGFEQAGAHLLAGRQHGDDRVDALLPSSASDRGAPSRRCPWRTARALASRS